MQPRDNGATLQLAKRVQPLQVGRARLVLALHGVQLADEFHGDAGLGPAALQKLPAHVRPAMRHVEAPGALPGQRFVDGVAVRHQHAAEVLQKLACRLGAAGVRYAVDDGMRAGQCPQVPLRLPRAAQQWPACLVHAQHLPPQLGEPQRFPGGQQQTGQRQHLVPESLAVHLKPLARHGAHLSLQGCVVEVLLHGDFQGEVERVAAPRHQPGRAQRRLHAPTAAAAVLLAAVALEDEAALHHVDFLCLLEAAFHFSQGTAALGALLVGLLQLMHHLFHWEHLLTGAMAGLPLLFARGGGGGVLTRTLLAGRAEEFGARLGQLALQLGQLQLEGARVGALRGQQRARQLHVAPHQPSVLRLQQQRRLAQSLDVPLFLQPHHGVGQVPHYPPGGKPSPQLAARARAKMGMAVAGAGASAARPTSSLPSKKSANSERASCTGCPSCARCQSAAKRPRSSRLA